MTNDLLKNRLKEMGFQIKPMPKVNATAEVHEYLAAIKRGEKILAERRAKKAEQKKVA
jgi:hypothetical protein